jgi:hypothetical protein
VSERTQPVPFEDIERALGRKAALTASGLAALGVGVLFAGIAAIDRHAVFDLLLPQEWSDGLRAWIEANLGGGGVGAQAAQVAEGARSFVAVALALCAFGGATVLAWLAGGALGTHLARRDGEWSPVVRALIAPTLTSRVAFVIHGGAAAMLLVWTAILLTHFLSWTALAIAAPLVTGAGLALAALALGALVPLLRRVEDPEASAVPQGIPPKDRSTADELLAYLRDSPVYRRQIVFERRLPAEPFLAAADGDALSRLVARWPRLSVLLRGAGVRSLSVGQAGAVKALLDLDRAATEGRRRDLTLLGQPGSGRSTTALLAGLGAVLHHEGALLYVTAEDPGATRDARSELPGGRGRSRDPSPRIARWLEGAKVSDRFRVESMFASQAGHAPSFRELDVLVACAESLCRRVLVRPDSEAAGFFARVRFVVIDHPERLGREALIRLRLAIARLRLVAEALGASPTFLVVLPPLANHDALSRHLLGEADTGVSELPAFHASATLVGWLPPMELADPEAASPTLVRGHYVRDVTELLVEVGRGYTELAAGGARESLRVAVIDPLPVLGPEARRAVQVALWRSMSEAGQSSATVLEWDFFSTPALSVDHAALYDVVLLLGAGAHPEHTVLPLRASLAVGGALFVLATPAPDDLESLRRMMRESWPRGEGARRFGPGVILPELPPDVVDMELAGLFGDLDAIPVPRQRLVDLMPSDHTRGQLEAWLERGWLRETHIFVASGHTVRPGAALVRADASLRHGRFAIPWGCTSRRWLDVYDPVAGDLVPDHASLPQQIDADRVFIDAHPFAVFRLPPASILVEGVEFAPHAAEGAATGRLLATSRTETRDVEIDRRKLRLDVAITADHPPGAEGEASDGAFSALVRGAAPGACWAALRRVSVHSDPSARPSVEVRVGHWPVTVAEQMRDVVLTDGRLVEEPGFIRREDLSAAQRHTREIRVATTHLWLTPVGGDAISALDEDGVRAVARLIEAWLGRSYLNASAELRVHAMVEQGAARIALYALRPSEEGAARTVYREVMGESTTLASVFEWATDTLGACTCGEGCAACCGGLGTCPTSRVASDPTFDPTDGIDRAKGLALLCAITGVSVDEAIERARRRRSEREAGPAGGGGAGPDGQQATDERLRRLVRDVVGTERAGYIDGLWAHLFGHTMPLPQGRVALAQWATDLDAAWAGLYRPDQNVVEVKPDYPDDTVREILVHEYAHCWQFQGGRFHLDEHVRGPEAQAYYEGKLVIEGHATWADHQFRALRQLGATYVPNDTRPWNEYKTGYLLIEAIERRVGERGLFAWLHEGCESRSKLRSRDPNLPWPFTLTQALQATGLLQAARSGRYTAIDVEFDTPEPPEGGSPHVA